MNTFLATRFLSFTDKTDPKGRLKTSIRDFQTTFCRFHHLYIDSNQDQV